MRAFSAEELTRMRAAQAEAMQDVCVWMDYAEMPDAINHPVPSWTDGAIAACGLEVLGGREQRGDRRTVVYWDAVLRLPVTFDFDLRDRVRITRQFGEVVVNPVVYDVAGPADIGPSGMLVRLRQVEPKVV